MISREAAPITTSNSQNVLSSESEATSDSDSQTPTETLRDNQAASITTSNLQNVLSSESEATSESDSQTPTETLRDNQGPKNDSEDENIQKAIEESLKERNNATNDDDEQKTPMKQFELDEQLFEQAEIRPKPKSTSIDIQEDGLTDAELKALHRLNSNATPNKVLKHLNEASRAKVIQAFEHIHGNGAESSQMAENRLPARNEMPTRQELPNEADVLDDLEFVALEELIKGNEKVLSELNEKSMLKVLDAAKKLGEEKSSKTSDASSMKFSPYLDQYHWRNFLLEDDWDDDKTNHNYGDMSYPSISRSKSMAQHGGTLSAKSPLKGVLQAFQAAQFNRRGPGVPTNNEKLALGAQLRQMSIGKSREMPTASYGNTSQSDVDRGLLAKLIERSNHSDLGMHSATAQSKQAKKEKQKKGPFNKNLSESSTDSP
uniref:Uncharacterized protein n=1 Tax=Globodera pallida TaxID=36090 RepID=A0A183BXX4_GLOPA